jgi:hypothetical protein
MWADFLSHFSEIYISEVENKKGKYEESKE